MARYSSQLGKKVEVVYRLGIIDLLAVGILVGDSGQFILVEQHCEQHGSVKTFHLKIPYDRMVRLNGTDPDSELALI